MLSKKGNAISDLSSKRSASSAVYFFSLFPLFKETKHGRKVSEEADNVNFE